MVEVEELSFASFFETRAFSIGLRGASNFDEEQRPFWEVNREVVKYEELLL